MKHFLSVVLLSLCSLAAFAQDADTSAVESEVSDYESDNTDSEETTAHELREPDQLTSTKNYQQEKVEVHKFDKKKWKDLVKDTDYREDPEKLEEQQPSEEEPPRSISPPITAAPIVTTIFYIIVIGVVVALLVVVINNTRRKKIVAAIPVGDDFSAPIEDIDHLDISYLLQQALGQGNLRLAIRLYYLDLLKKLNEASIIVWEKDKTNRDYLTELFQKNFMYDEIRHLTLAYEKVWYGEHAVRQDSFDNIVKDFEWIKAKIQTPAS